MKLRSVVKAGVLSMALSSGAQAANVPLASFDILSLSSATGLIYSDTLSAGASISRGFELSGTGGDVMVDFLSLRIPTFVETSITMSYFIDSNNDNLLDPTSDLSLASMTGSRSSFLRNLNVGQALFVTYLNSSSSTVLATTGFTPMSETVISPVPVPAAAWLFGSALFVIGARARSRKAV